MTSLTKNIALNEKAPLLPQQSSLKNNTDTQSESDIQQCNIKNLKLSRDLMYLSHVFAKGSDEVWQFCLVLFLAAFTNYENLILVSTFNLFSRLVVCCSSGHIGSFIDCNERLLTARIFIWVQNMSVVAATYCCYLLLDDKSEKMLHIGSSGRIKGVPTSSYGITLLIGLHVFGAISNVLDQGITVAIEKDWVVVMSKYNGKQQYRSDMEEKQTIKDWLSETNVTMTQIDLTCQSLGPVISGYLLAIYGDNLKGAALFVGLLNIACLIVEWFCTAFIYQRIPDLSIKLDSSSQHSLTQSERSSDLIDEEELDIQMNGIMTSNSYNNIVCTNEKENKFCQSLLDFIPVGWRIYMKQPTAYSGLALSLLYFNILCFGAIMTAYLVWRGMTLESIGTWRGVSAVIGLLGTFAFRISISKLSLAQTGMWSITFQFLCLSLSYISLFVQNNTLSLTMLIGGVCASRIGLWVFDITMKQFFQECVEEEFRGIVGGLQNSLNAFFGLITFVLGIVFPDPTEFHILVASGYVSVGIALLFYWLGFYGRNKTL